MASGKRCRPVPSGGVIEALEFLIASAFSFSPIARADEFLPQASEGRAGGAFTAQPEV